MSEVKFRCGRLHYNNFRRKKSRAIEIVEKGEVI